MEMRFVTGGVSRVGRGVLAACLAGSLALAPLTAGASNHRIALVPTIGGLVVQWSNQMGSNLSLNLPIRPRVAQSWPWSP